MHRITTTAPFALLMLGCSSDPVVSDTGTAPIDRPEPSPYESAEPAPLAPTLTAEQLAKAIPGAMKVAKTIDPDRIFAAYMALDAHAEPGCPEERTDVTDADGGRVIYWYAEGCTTADGTWFSGLAQLEIYVETLDDGTQRTGFGMFSEILDIEAADGTSMRGGAAVLNETYVGPAGGTFYLLYFEGSVVVDELTAAGNPWLTGALRGNLTLTAGDYGDARELGVDGSLRSTEPLYDIAAVQLGEIAVDSFGCPLRVSGEAAVRDQLGGWHDAAFGDREDPVCDACADMSFAGEALGTFCSDEPELPELLVWETKPW